MSNHGMLEWRVIKKLLSGETSVGESHAPEVIGSKIFRGNVLFKALVI